MVSLYHFKEEKSGLRNIRKLAWCHIFSECELSTKVCLTLVTILFFIMLLASSQLENWECWEICLYIKHFPASSFLSESKNDQIPLFLSFK